MAIPSFIPRVIAAAFQIAVLVVCVAWAGVETREMYLRDNPGTKLPDNWQIVLSEKGNVVHRWPLQTVAANVFAVVVGTIIVNAIVLAWRYVVPSPAGRQKSFWRPLWFYFGVPIALIGWLIVRLG